MRTEDPIRPGVYLASSVLPQDEVWGRARIIGSDSDGNSLFSLTMTDWTALDAYAGLSVIRLPTDSAVHVELRFHPPASAQGGTTWRQGRHSR